MLGRAPHAKLLGPVALILAVAGCGGSQESAIEIVPVSTRADAVSGDELLVAVEGVADAAELRLLVDGDDVTDAAAPTAREGRVLALVGSLAPGTHEIEARAGGASSMLEVEAHASSGPVFSGEQLPLRCTTRFAGLGPPADEDCSVDAVTSWFYATRDGRILPLSDPARPPADAASIPSGEDEVPFVIRLELGTINRSLYAFAVPAPAGEPSPLSANRVWNERLVYRFRGGCGTQYSQGLLGPQSVLDLGLLEAGYAVATASFNTAAVSCNDVLAAETMMMVREHVIETLGPPAATIGEGTSGGTIQQLLIAQNYPGLLDAIAGGLPFPDFVTVLSGAWDCGLLNAYHATADWSESEMAAVNGHPESATCAAWERDFAGLLDPADGCAEVPPAERYSSSNPEGVRCTFHDFNRNLFGIDPVTGFALRPYSNEGVQYGLEALGAGAISVEQFLDLNQRIGGYDIDGNPVAARSVADEDSLRRAYEQGRVLHGGGEVTEIPISMTSTYTDALGDDVHERFRAFSIRARFERAGGSPGLIVRTFPAPGDSSPGLPPPVAQVALLDQWLSDGRPAAAEDGCLLADGFETGAGVEEPGGACHEAYPPHGAPRTAAGAPLTDHIVACSLAAPVRGEYEVVFTDAQWERLLAIFPEGVCDWQRPGIGEVPLAGTWLGF